MHTFAFFFLIGLSAGFAWSVGQRRQALRRKVISALEGPGAWEASHALKVERISRQLRARRGSAPLVLRKRTVSHQVPKAKDHKYTDEAIDISDLDRILHIDPIARTCVAEAGVTFYDLVAATLEHGLVPIVVPELKTITLGGAVAGCSLESMSFVHGGFHDTCFEYEVITAKGEVLVCTPENEHQLTFQMVHGTFGTLGIVSKLSFKLVPSRKYVKLIHERYANLPEYQAAIWRHFKARDVEFIDGFIHSPTEYVLCVGNFVDEAPYANRYDWMKVFCQSTRERSEDYLETVDYLFRYDRGVTNTHPKSWLGRLLLGRFLDSSFLLRAAQVFHRVLSVDRPTMTLDVFLPFSKVPEFLAWYRGELGSFPLWCVPYRRVRDYEWASRAFYENMKDELFVDLAIYGVTQRPGTNEYKLLEDKLLELGGIKTLISHNYYSEADFWKTWNKDNYQAVKSKTDPDNVFRDLYAKTCRAARGLE